MLPAVSDAHSISHDSAPAVGFRATTVQQYAHAIADVLCMDEEKRMGIAAAARAMSSQFSQQRFAADFAAAMQPLLQ